MPPVLPGDRAEESAGGRNLLLLRTGITFALLASVVSVHFREPTLFLSRGFQFLYAAVVLSYGWLLARYALRESRALEGPVVVIQAAVDVAFVSILVYATGLFDSVFVFMYVVVILLGSIEAYMKGAILWAFLSAAAYCLLLVLQMEGILLPPGVQESQIGWREILRPMLTHSIGFLLTGGLAGVLGEDIRKTRLRVLDQEDHLQQLETFHKHVVDNIPSGILTTDTSGRVSLINDAACEILGVRKEEISGGRLGDLLEGLLPEAGESESVNPRQEMVFRRSDGAEIFLGFSASPLRDSEGRVIGRVVIFQDLTPVKQMEERVRIADRLAAIGELAAGLAHEIRNPLASIAGSTQMLRESTGAAGEALPLLDIIEKESTRLNILISDFLAYTGPSIRAAGSVSLDEVLREVGEAVRTGEAREKGVQVTIADSRGACVEGDAEQLKQVMWNLVRNAIQATPEGGDVRLDISSRLLHGVRYAVASVADSGHGIEPSIIGKIFNPFFTSKKGGTGLGLSISQRIVHLHRGFIDVKSIPGKGSVFSVYLPEHREALLAGRPGR